MNRVCADCAQPSYCKYKGLCMASGIRREDDACDICPDPYSCAKSWKCQLVSSHIDKDAPTTFVNAADEVRKATPIDAIFKFWPDAMVALAQHIWEGNKRYNPNHPVVEWNREKSSDHVGSLMRHMVDYFLADSTEERLKVMRAVAWRAMAQLQLLTEEKGDG